MVADTKDSIRNCIQPYDPKIKILKVLESSAHVYSQLERDKKVDYLIAIEGIKK
jgi:hypothetical protein